jgi:hypothetical protein
MEPDIIQIDKQLAEKIEFLHYINDLNAEKMNVGMEFKMKMMIKE